MAQPSYNIEDVYKAIYKINNYFGEFKRNGLTFDITDGLIRKYCQYGNKSGYGNCRDYLEKASSGVINLLTNLKDTNGLEYDKLAEYAILWLRYKLNQKSPYNSTKLNDFYTKYIEKNKYYDEKIKGNGSPTYKEIIDKKKDLMNINEMTKFSYPFSILLFLYNATNANKLDCTNYSYYASEFATRFKGFNNDPNNIEGSSYNKILSTISNDYDNLKNKYNKKSCNFPSLPELIPQKRPEEISEKGSAQNIVESPVGNSGQPTALSSEVTSSSSSISTTLIPALSIVSIIPVFLGISYKVNNKELKTIIFL
ncbi:CIR protein PIR protein [Plasmodium vinckei vinckei]|uniref:CIR protein PIR protein n=1 Tax=Plasmodium vinckei vinckei TaxID=54757 RepID=A0A449BQ83_PLAVN|nr:CIR protein PIR protein [Plasmodium vinckei vinckei]VEV55626.1 CIR protein PIR protein [Plasmodium vinckei vinckei]